MEEKIYYKRNLPHIQPANGVYFVTFRLGNSLPKSVTDRLIKEHKEAVNKLEELRDKNLKEEMRYRLHKKYFGKFDALLDKTNKGALWLKNDKIAKIVKDSICYRDGREYNLYAFCVMPNHVHVLFEIEKKSRSLLKTGFYPVTKILQALKIHSAIKANIILGRSGQFWHNESYDHIVRNDKEFENIINYIIQNPVKAGFVKNWRDWKWSYSYFHEVGLL